MSAKVNSHGSINKIMNERFHSDIQLSYSSTSVTSFFVDHGVNRVLIFRSQKMNL